MFQSAQCEKASMLTAMASRMAMRLGVHKDPSNFDFPPWIAEMRRRMWNHLVYLDNPYHSGEGASTPLDSIAAIQRCINCDDDEWTPARSTPRVEAMPLDQDGFTEMSFAIVRNEVYDCARRMTQPSGRDELHRAVMETETLLQRRFMGDLDDTEPLQQLFILFVRCSMQMLGLLVEFSSAKSSRQADLELQAR
jgi:hypothetical protein